MQALPPRRGVPAAGGVDPRLAALPGVAHRRAVRGDEPRRLLHQPRGAPPPLRAGADAAAAAPRPAGTTCRPTCRGSACARRSSAAPTSSTSAASPTRSRVKVGSGGAAGRAARAGGRARSRPRARAPHLHPPLRRTRRSPPACRRWSRPCAPAGRTVLWVCDPMHGNTEALANGIKTRRFDDILSRARAGLRPPRGARLLPRRRPLRAHRRGRHRVHGRRPRPHRGGPPARLPLAGRPAPQLRAGAGDGLADRPADGAGRPADLQKGWGNGGAAASPRGLEALRSAGLLLGHAGLLVALDTAVVALDAE